MEPKIFITFKAFDISLAYYNHSGDYSHLENTMLFFFVSLTTRPHLSQWDPSSENENNSKLSAQERLLYWYHQFSKVATLEYIMDMVLKNIR